MNKEGSVLFLVQGRENADWIEFPGYPRNAPLAALGCASDDDQRCWIRPANGRYRDVGWVEVTDEQTMHLVCESWASDATVFYVVSRPRAETSPNKKPPPRCSRAVALAAAAAAAHSPTKAKNSPSKKSPGKKEVVVADPGLVPDRIKRLEFSQPGNKIDMFTCLDIEPDDDSNVVVMDAAARTRAFNGEMLEGFIRSKVAQGVPPNQIEVDNIQLSLDVWFSCLTRSNKLSHKFACLLHDMAKHIVLYQEQLQKLRANSELYERLKFFIRDLLNFGSDEGAQERLASNSNFFFSTAYFSDEEIGELFKFRTVSGFTLRDMLEDLVASRSELCASHDLAPLLLDVFNIRKGYQEENAFKANFKEFKKAWAKRRKSSG